MLLLLSFLMPLSTMAQEEELGDTMYNDSTQYESDTERTAPDGYYLQKIAYDITIHKNRRYDVNEVLSAYFVSKRHGLYRRIPKGFWVNRDVSEAQDRTEMSMRYNKVELEDVHVSEAFELEKTKELYNIRIGNPHSMVEGCHVYDLTYSLQLPGDRVDVADLFFHSIVGTGWTCDIDTVTFAIHFDQPLPQSAIDSMKVHMGKEGNEEDVRNMVITYVDKHTIEGRAYGLQTFEGLTIFMPLPEGYFDKGSVTIWAVLSWIAAGLLAIALIFLTIYIIKGEKKPTKVLSFYPPKGVDSAAAGCIIDGHADDKDLLSLIPWFAYNKMLSIQYDGSKISSLNKGNNAAGIASMNDYQRRLYNGFFEKKSTFILDKANSKFGNSWTQSMAALQAFCNKNVKSTDTHSGLVVLSTFLLSLIVALAMVEPDGFIYGGVMNVALYCIYLIMRKSSRTREKIRYGTGNERLKGVIKLLLKGFALFNLIGLTFGILIRMEDSYFSVEILLLLLIVQIILLLFTRRLNHMSEYRFKMLGEIEGFKEFINTAERSTLEHLVEEDAQYFYRILPYAMVFGLTTKWVTKFNGFKMESHESFTNMDYTSMQNAFVGTTLISDIERHTAAARAERAAQSMSSSSSYSSSGGSYSSSSGHSGGYSGGGSGGGGGGSW